ncbi:hypothetical protein [Streptomyces chromofuscus]|uniref:Uncharacterized protein n=1 Tax=Streptomyces chromofuscus TaxID=42881 RepID=A0A7M2TI38_STRCW|nr:hypothetical protein [Streptomyces chromofuscus]QOV47894.1 hypothetical protein IPT68_22150 [Streptomyces chromofuscus]
MRRLIERGRSGCRTGTASAAALGAALTLVLWGAPSASAGGPTSVLLVSQQSAEAAGLVHSDERYVQLDQLLGQAGAGDFTKPSEAHLAETRQVNITWLAHDVDPWRMHQVYADADSTAVWIHTATNLPNTTNGHWHRAQQPTALRTLLKELGVLGPLPDDAGREVVPPVPAAEPDSEPTGRDSTVDESTVAAQPSSASADEDSGWSWAIPGLAAGLALGAGGSLLIRRAAGRPEAGPPHEEPRQELIDL